MPPFQHLHLLFRDAAQRAAVQEVIHDRLADDRQPEECRYLMRFRAQLGVPYVELTPEQLARHVAAEKRAVLDRLLEALATHPAAVDAWLAWCHEHLPVVADRGFLTDDGLRRRN